MPNKYVPLIKQTINGYLEDECLSRGAAIAFYTVTSLAPVLVIVIVVAGLVFGQDAARGAIVRQLSGLIGQDGAALIQSMVKSAGRDRDATFFASLLGGLTLLITASGVFGEMQTALNAIWKAKPDGSTVGRMIKARAQSLGLVITLGFLMAVSLVLSTAVAALGDLINHSFPGGSVIMQGISFLVSLALIGVLFAAIYKVLPDTHLDWQDVIVGALVTSFLFNIGKILIGLYLGSSSVASSYGAAGALVLLLLWVYYSSQTFLLGAEFTKAYAHSHGSRA
jgi:membrane protein